MSSVRPVCPDGTCSRQWREFCLSVDHAYLVHVKHNDTIYDSVRFRQFVLDTFHDAF